MHKRAMKSGLLQFSTMHLLTAVSKQGCMTEATRVILLMASLIWRRKWGAYVVCGRREGGDSGIHRLCGRREGGDSGIHRLCVGGGRGMTVGYVVCGRREGDHDRLCVGGGREVTVGYVVYGRREGVTVGYVVCGKREGVTMGYVVCGRREEGDDGM